MIFVIGAILITMGATAIGAVYLNIFDKYKDKENGTNE